MTYEQFIHKIDKLIWGLVHKYSVKGYDNDDVRQELLMKCYDVYHLYDNKNAISTFITPILTNHIINLINKGNTDIRCNKDECGNNLSDIKLYNFDRLINKKDYNQYELDILNSSKEFIDTYPHKDIINRILNGETQVKISKDLQCSRQYVSYIFIDFKKKLKAQLGVKPNTLKERK